MARDQANRIVLQRSRAALEARLALLRRMRSSSNVTPHGSGPGGPNPEEIRQIEEKLAGIAAIENRLRTVPGRPQAYLVGFSADGNGRAIVAIGNPDTAANVATYVPGTGARLGTIGGDIRRADIMVADAGAAPGGTAVITWIGYDAPQQVSRIGHPGSPSAMSPSYAANAAAALRSFQAGLDISHTGGGDFNKTVLGHSYGTTVVGHAARGGGFSADNLVFVASPGVGENVNQASDLRFDGRVYATRAANDPISVTPPWTHGPQPTTTDFGAHVFPSAPGSVGGSAHSEYWDPGNPARSNIARIITGRHGEVEVDRFRMAPQPMPPPGGIRPHGT